METQFAQGPRWPTLNDRALQTAYAITESGCRSWCLLTSWRHNLALDANRKQHAMLDEGLRRDGQILALTAHYRDGATTRQEPWIFACDVKRPFAVWLLRRLHQPLLFWGDHMVHVLTASDPPRPLGEFRPGAIAHAIGESSSDAATFLGFDLPR